MCHEHPCSDNPAASGKGCLIGITSEGLWNHGILEASFKVPSGQRAGGSGVFGGDIQTRGDVNVHVGFLGDFFYHRACSICTQLTSVEVGKNSSICINFQK